MTRVVLVTGSSSGIGLALAERFAAGGDAVVLHGLEPEGAQIASDLGRRHGVRCLYDRADLCRPEAGRGLVERCLRELGRLDVLINNAGIQHVAPVEDFPADAWQRVLALNLSAPYYLAQAAWPALRSRRQGRIINIASVHGLRASPFKAAYVAAKHGLIGLTKALAVEGAPHGITANAICPGYVRTPLVDRQIADQAKAHGLSPERVTSEVLLAKQAIKEFIPAAALGEMAVFLASELAATTTGAAMTIDGGWTCQ